MAIALGRGDVGAQDREHQREQFADRAVDPRRLPAWAELGERVEFVEFPGGHFSPYEPASGFLSALNHRLAPLPA